VKYLLLGLLLFPAFTVGSVPEVVKQVLPSVVTIVVKSARETYATGVHIDARGYILTCNHVLGTARYVVVRLTGGKECEGTVIWRDPAVDLAVIRVGRQLQPLKLAAADPIVGDAVIAVGHPFGFTNTVSTGIVSALGREIEMPSGRMLGELIQTTAAINPGNSGGPLLNIKGELIGINVAVRDGAQGIAFAVGATSVKDAVAKALPKETSK
jgi:serine protease Do